MAPAAQLASSFFHYLRILISFSKPSWQGAVKMMSKNIAGKVVVITGASSGLGKATARLLCVQGQTLSWGRGVGKRCLTVKR